MNKLAAGGGQQRLVTALYGLHVRRQRISSVM